MLGPNPSMDGILLFPILPYYQNVCASSFNKKSFLVRRIIPGQYSFQPRGRIKNWCDMFSLFNNVGLYSTAHTQMMRCKIIGLGRRSLLFQMVFATAMLLQLFLPLIYDCMRSFSLFSCLELIVVAGAL